MLDGLFVTPAVTAIGEALASARAEGPVLVLGNAKLAAALADTREVLAAGMSARAVRHLKVPVTELAALAPGAVAAVVAPDVATLDGWEAQLAAWARVVRDDGLLVFVDKGHAPEASRRALCAGLTEIEQRLDGRTVVTSGLVTHL